MKDAPDDELGFGPVIKICLFFFLVSLFLFSLSRRTPQVLTASPYASPRPPCPPFAIASHPVTTHRLCSLIGTYKKCSLRFAPQVLAAATLLHDCHVHPSPHGSPPPRHGAQDSSQCYLAQNPVAVNINSIQCASPATTNWK